MSWTELAQTGKVPLAYITGKDEESNGFISDILTDLRLHNDRLDMAYRQLDNHPLREFRNGVSDRRVSGFDISLRWM